MKVLLGFSYYKYPYDIQEWVEDWLNRIRDSLSIKIDKFCLTIDPPNDRLSWKELDLRWKARDYKLIALYKQLYAKSKSYDVFINWNGINLHPEFIEQLPTFNVFGCFDDPEASDDLSKPVAKYYDLSLIGNIAEIENYKHWGVRHVAFWPNGFRKDEYNPNLTKEKILNGKRDVDVTLLCEKTSGWRSQRLDKYAAAFPQGKFYGKGWPSGFLEESEKINLYQRTKIGINFHNSTGPINFRTFTLPANGIMQICDNKKHLGKVFKLNKEVVGFETVEEAIELTKYYLNHDDERRKIAAAGFERSIRDYNEISVFKQALLQIKKFYKSKNKLADAGESAYKQLINNPPGILDQVNLKYYQAKKKAEKFYLQSIKK